MINRIKAEFRDLGALSLKNIERPVRALQVVFVSGDRANADAIQSGRPQGGGSTAGLSIAVRPFKVLSEDRGLEFLANGLAEDVIALLARVPGFFLISRASSFAFQNLETPTSVIAGQLGVRYVVEGSVRGAGDQVRVSTQLAEAATGRILWSGKFEATRAETLELQDQIARGIMIELEPALTQAEIRVIRRQRPENVDAWGTTTRPRARLVAAAGTSRLFQRHRTTCNGHSTWTLTSPLRVRSLPFCRRLRKTPALSNTRQSMLKKR